MTGAPPPAEGPLATVVVPTRDRPRQLAACLAALAAQRVACLEVVVVDDGSQDAAAVAAVVAAVPRARLLHGDGRGPAAARNLGAAAAGGPVVCFTDDDCRPGPGWVRALLDRFDAGADAVAGPTRNGRPGDPFATASQLVTNHLTAASAVPGSPPRLGFAPTSNLAVRAALHRRLPFDETYPLAAGEDREWCSRLAAEGLALELAPAAWVDHDQDLSLRRFWRQQVRYGRGAHRWHCWGGGARRRNRRGGQGPRRPLQPARFYLDLLRAGARHGPVVAALVLLAQVATAAGAVREALADRGAGPVLAAPDHPGPGRPVVGGRR